MVETVKVKFSSWALSHVEKINLQGQADDTETQTGADLEHNQSWDFPGGPGVKIPYIQCRGHVFDTWSGN